MRGHSALLHPRTGETLEFTAEVPAIFEKTLEDLRKG